MSPLATIHINIARLRSLSVRPPSVFGVHSIRSCPELIRSMVNATIFYPYILSIIKGHGELDIQVLKRLGLQFFAWYGVFYYIILTSPSLAPILKNLPSFDGTFLLPTILISILQNG